MVARAIRDIGESPDWSLDGETFLDVTMSAIVKGGWEAASLVFSQIGFADLAEKINELMHEEAGAKP